MITLRALLFSLSIFWRLLIAFPVIILACIGIGAVAGLVGGILSFFVPVPIIALLGTVLMFALTVLPILVALRIGLVTCGIKPLCPYAKLAMPALGYGSAVGIVLTALTAAGIGLFIWQAGLTMEDYETFQDPRLQGIIRSKIIDAIPLGIWIACGMAVLACSFMAALLMPMAGASVGRDPNGHRHTPLAGFGQAFVPLVILVALGTGLTVITQDILIAGASLIGQDEYIRSGMQIEGYLQNGELEAGWQVKYAVIILASSIFGLYTMSLYCAGAVLAYMDRTNNDGPEALPPEEIETPRLAQAEVRALWKDRMPTLD